MANASIHGAAHFSSACSSPSCSGRPKPTCIHVHESRHGRPLGQLPEEAHSFEALRHLQAEQSNNANLEVHTIPVVVHVLHLGSEVGVDENISDEQIVSAIDALNEDYRRMAGTNGEGDGVDTIQFELAKRDPDGNPTSITRMNASKIAGYADDGVASIHPSQVPPNWTSSPVAWNRDDYINFFIVNRINGDGDGVNGYTYPFRTFNPILDGVVQRFDTFGTVGNQPGTSTAPRRTKWGTTCACCTRLKTPSAARMKRTAR